MRNNVSLFYISFFIFTASLLLHCGKSQENDLWALLLINQNPEVVQPEAPLFSPAGGSSYSGGQSITISSITASSNIYYTKNGSNPSASDTLYSGPITCYIPAFTLKAVAIKDGITSAISSSGFNCNICSMNSQCPGSVCSSGFCQ
ncbi:hypothetical protein EHQ61_18470 [Leptospira wolffii]|uniref:chitobiase/beta-hexosaminidase C-terminal domain-containing protein n=1 Tax=Leptospira wolffii TaxID=409998 RepID=UPI000352F304|nr:chitobiase/beta-hexosaminidase C-terminal domain protein [Leptospira wolffii serovar Khorat str. Khorat-H2]TGL45719.1 hypothetical protein EHQ61_18470 [Leptospira wolffii]